MNYAYVAYTAEKKLVKGKLSATNEETAANLLNYGGYQMVSLKQVTPFVDMEKLIAYFSKIRTREIVMFSRQLAILLESGTDIVTALELLHGQIENRTLKKMIFEVSNDIRGGVSLSKALGKHPQAFSRMYFQAIAAGEQSGNLEVVLRQMADFIERGANTEKKVKNALTYPIVVSVVAIIVIGILISFVLPTFVNLYASFGADLPLATRILLGSSDWIQHYGIYPFGAIAVIAIGLMYAITKTPVGKLRWHKFILIIPIIGRINLLNELSRSCQTMSLLFRVGLPLPEIMEMVIQGTSNQAMVKAFTEVQQRLVRGEGLSGPMARESLFLPMMVQMVKVGEETGNLDNTLLTVAESFEAEADDKTSVAVGLIQPAMTVFIGVLIAFIAVALLSAMYSVYGQLSF